MKSFQCVFCASTEGQILLGGCKDYFTGIAGRFDYVRCRSCGLVQLSPVPENLADYYQSYPVHAAKSPLHLLMRRLCMSRGYYLVDPPAAGAHVLDFGCGDGWYLEEMRRRGWRTSGFEFSADHARSLAEACGCPVFSDPTELERAHSHSFDAVTMHFVLEHLDRPLVQFERVGRLLKKGGVFYFIIPNLDSTESRLFRRKWHGLDPPRHITFLNDSHVQRSATQNRFRIRNRKAVPLPTGFAGSMASVLAGKFDFVLFALMIVPGLLFSAVCRDGNLAYTLEKQ